MTIGGLGARGGGIVLDEPQRLYVADALPGETCLVQPESRRGDGWTARVLDRLTDSPDRVAARCRHFGQCGGCQAQHLSPPAYTSWKRELVVTAFRQADLPTACIGLLAMPVAGMRRRVRLVARRHGTNVRFGFQAFSSHVVVDVAECPVMRADVWPVVTRLRPILPALLTDGRALDVAVLMTDTGADVLVIGPGSLGLEAREALATAAQAGDWARVSWQSEEAVAPEPVCCRHTPVLTWGGTPVEVPPGTFVQASAEVEASLLALAVEATGSAQTVADLYAGCGSFSFALAAVGRHVHAVDRNAAAIAAVRHSAGMWSRPLTTECRDLVRRPLSAAELNRFDAVVLDPPRAGAANQAAELARSAAPVVVSVSCRPATAARDAATLVAGGYRLVSVTLFDQFVWSPHVELLLVLQRS